MDRVREAIFSSLGDAVPGSRVLDLFAGSGALGIEALSRGAASAVFVDSSPEAVRCIRRNLERTRLDGTIIRADAYRYLESCAEGIFDLIFADPPYAKRPGDRDFASELAAAAAFARALAGGGTAVIECVPGRPPAAPDGLEMMGCRKYGTTAVVYFVKRIGGGE